jgi:hypothetical protein
MPLRLLISLGCTPFASDTGRLFTIACFFLQIKIADKLGLHSLSLFFKGNEMYIFPLGLVVDIVAYCYVVQQMA